MAWLDEEVAMQQMPRPSPVYQRVCDGGHAIDVAAVRPDMADALLGTICHVWLTSVASVDAASAKKSSTEGLHLELQHDSCVI